MQSSQQQQPHQPFSAFQKHHDNPYLDYDSTQPSSAMLTHLPKDIQLKLISDLPQSSLAALAQSCVSLRQLTTPLLWRMLRCVSCQSHLFHPRELLASDVHAFRVQKAPHGPTSSLPRRCFLQLDRRSPSDLKQLGLQLDERRGAANFHVLRHLAQTVYRDTRFPLPTELQAVRALRCEACKVFVGFRHEDHGYTRDFVHHEFIELVDIHERIVNLAGHVLPEKSNVVKCATPNCNMILFEKEDMLPWTHVLSSTRLTDLDAYLEWDHSWSGADTAHQPAFFIKRLVNDATIVKNVRPEHLRQGHMEIGDLHCKGCEKHIGWKFLAELPENSSDFLHNYDQIRRFGIIRTAVTPADPRYQL